MSRRATKRKRARRGRPRDAEATRTASGRKSRARRPREDPRTVALEARRRVFGLSSATAAHEQAATVLGRLWLAGEIGEPLRDAGERFLETRNEAMRALKAPIGLAASGVTGSAGDQVSDDYVAWARRAVSRYEALRTAIEAIGARSVVQRVVVEDQSVPAASLPILIDGLQLLAVELGVRSVGGSVKSKGDPRDAYEC